MSLIEEVKKRIPAQRLIQLTNTDNTNASTIDDDVLELACDDTSKNFTEAVGVDYDNDNPTHLANIVDGVLITLMKWAERWNKAMQEMEDRWYEKLNKLRLSIGGNVRLSPQTNSQLTPSDDKRGQTITTVRPDFDSSKFDSLKPNPPFGSDSEET